jgi:transposase
MSGAHLSTDERRIALRMVIEERLSYELVARVLRCHKSTISRLVERFATTGEFETVHSGGRQPLLDATQLQILDQHIAQHATATAVGLQRTLPSSVPPLSERTLQNYRRVLGYTPRHGRITARQSGSYDAKRWAWAWHHRRELAIQWVHTDESTVRMQETGDIIWVKRGQLTPAFEVQKLRCNVNVWGMVWDEGSVFVHFSGYLNTALFIDLLEQHLLPLKESLAGRTLLIDQHPVHRTQTVQRWLTEQGFQFVMLPTHSPRFNGIEECWSWMKRYVRRLSPRDEAELTLAIQEAGELLPPHVITAHLAHAQRSIRECAYREEEEHTTQQPVSLKPSPLPR